MVDKEMEFFSKTASGDSVIESGKENKTVSMGWGTEEIEPPHQTQEPRENYSFVKKPGL